MLCAAQPSRLAVRTQRRGSNPGRDLHSLTAGEIVSKLGTGRFSQSGEGALPW